MVAEEIPIDPRIEQSENQSKEFANNGMAQKLTKPLLSYSWSSSFSFSKCHLDTNVPYDPFLTQSYDTEEFTRYARMFTHGYDTYTATQNIVYHDFYKFQDLDKYIMKKSMSWSHDEKEKYDSIERVKTILGINNMPERQKVKYGVYGLGKLRSLQQLQNFVGIKLKSKFSNMNKPTCSELQWVPYNSQDDENEIINSLPQDTNIRTGVRRNIQANKHLNQNSNTTSISPNNTHIQHITYPSKKILSIAPMDNLYEYSTTTYSFTNDNLDPQPEFTNRIVSRIPMSFYFNESKYEEEPAVTLHYNMKWGKVLKNVNVFITLILFAFYVGRKMKGRIGQLRERIQMKKDK